MMSLPVWLSGPMFLLRGLCPWSYVPSGGVYVEGGLYPGGLCPGGVSASYYGNCGCKKISGRLNSSSIEKLCL